METNNMKNYQWLKVNSKAAFAPRDGAGALVFRDKMWLIGGWNPNDKTHFPLICNSEVWSSIDGAQWKLECHAPWEARHCAGYVVHNGRMWIAGGDMNQKHYQNDVWSSADGTNWDELPDTPWPERHAASVFVYAHALWIVAGNNMTSDVWKLHLQSG